MPTGLRTKFNECKPGLIIHNQDKTKLSFERWFAELKQLAEDDYSMVSKDFNESSWQGYYEEFYTPIEAIERDFYGIHPQRKENKK